MAFGLSAATWGMIGAVGSIGMGLMAGDGGASDANAAAANASNTQADIARDQWNRYKSVYAPLEYQMVNDAAKYDSPEAYQRAAGEASATVGDQFGKARERLNRTPGLDPSSAGYGAQMVGLDIAQASNDAIAQNTARQGVRDMAYSRKMGALGLGKGLDATASSGLATAASNSATLANNAYNRSASQAGAMGGMIGNLANAAGKVATQNAAGTASTSIPDSTWMPTPEPFTW